ncbi:MAG: adenosine deaminase [Bdellovibrionales bacterium]
MNLTPSQIRSLPKIDLHRHLDCSLRWSTVVEVAQDLKMELPQPPAKARSSFLITEPMANLEAVLNKFLNTQKVLASDEILERLAFEACEDAFNDNVLLLELRFAPTFILDGHPHLSPEKIISAFRKGLNRAEKTYGLSAGLIGILQRIKPIEQSQTTMDFFCDMKSEFIGVDLADNEEGFDPAPFASLFQKAKKSGLRVTIHSGEVPHPQAGQWIMDSINYLGAERIGHGVQAIHHPKVLEQIKKQNVTLEICPLSNYLTQAFPDPASHPLKKLMEAGVKVTLGSDDPGIFASQLTDDYLMAHQHQRLNLQDFKQLNQNAFESSFIDPLKKKKWETFFYE